MRLADEIALLERYAELEQLRLGERLRITWELDEVPADALVPPLVLQPLLENAVYHGVEPGTGGRRGAGAHRAARRPRARAHRESRTSRPRPQRAGNRMALENIRERLQLHFDAEARMRPQAAGGRYHVEIEIPYKVGAMSMTLKVFIVDDEAPARERLKELLGDIARRGADERRGRGAQRRGGARARAGERRRGRAARHPDAGHGRHRGRAPPARAASARRHRLRHRVRPPRGRGLRGERARLPAEAGARRAPAAALRKAAGARTREQLAKAAEAPREYLSVAERNRILLVPVGDILYLHAELKYVTRAHARRAST